MKPEESAKCHQTSSHKPEFFGIDVVLKHCVIVSVKITCLQCE